MGALEAPEHGDANRSQCGQGFTGKARLVASLIGVAVGAAMLMTTYGGNTGVFLTAATKPEFLQKEQAEMVAQMFTNESFNEVLATSLLPHAMAMVAHQAKCEDDDECVTKLFPGYPGKLPCRRLVLQHPCQNRKWGAKISTCCPKWCRIWQATTTTPTTTTATTTTTRKVTARCFDGNVAEFPRDVIVIDCDDSRLRGDGKDLPRHATRIGLAWSQLNGDVGSLPRGATHINLAFSQLNGDVGSLPRGATTINLAFSGKGGQGGLTGDVKDLPRSTTYINLAFSTLRGDLSDLPRGAKVLNLQLSELTGDVANLPRGANQIYLTDSTLTGTVADMPKGSEQCFLDGSVGFSCGDLQDVRLCTFRCYVRLF